MPIVVEGANPYADCAALIGRLPDLTRNARAGYTRAGYTLTVAQQAKLIGVGSDTLLGFEAGSNCTKNTLLAILAYLATLV